ncbi:hypothetical protein SEA_MAGRITTE_18 [Microbacterium phage Magritte]|nr:hypothetical protein SEA_MAGRITTE_18 [Microbacterium phage Magritte]
MDYEIPTKEQLLAFAEKVVSDPDEILESEYFDYSEDINELLLELRDGEALSDVIRKELTDLYDEWEAEDFPVAVDDEDEIREGGPKPEESDSEDDPDLLPDPEDV